MYKHPFVTMDVSSSPSSSPGYGILSTYKVLSLLFKHWKIQLCYLQPYQDENTGSRLISEVYHLRAWVVLGWVTTWEVQVL